MGCNAFHKGKYYVNIKRGYEDHKKDLTITIDKVYEKESLRVILSDEEDPTFLCSLHVTRCDYEDLKKQQGLLIDFDNFPSQLVRLLQQSSTNNMFLILQQSNQVQYYFEVVEHNEFRRLVHLSLKAAPANDTDIKKHMSDTIINLKKSLLAVKSSLSSSEAMWNDKCIMMERKIHDLTLAVAKMEEEKARKETECKEVIKHEKERLAQEKAQLQRTCELNVKSQQTALQDQIARKDKQIDELNSVLKQQKEAILKLEGQFNEKCQCLCLLEKEVQKAHIDVATIKAKNATLERDIMEKEKQLHQFNIKYCDLEKMFRDNEETLRDLQTTVRVLKKEKQSLEERLAVSDSLLNKNNEAAHSTSGQLLKANQIISKQNADLLEMKEKLLCRTAIALEQEKVIERNNKEIEVMKSEINTTKQNVEKLTAELDNLREKYDSNEKALKEKDDIIKNNNMVIQWLHKKMEDNCIVSETQNKSRQGMLTATSSTPYFIQNKNNCEPTLHGLSDESINFYATSKSDVEDSPKANVQKNGKAGLDPKYLKPASNDSKGPVHKPSTTSQRGKENQEINLPKVDYREKKSSRTNTYRTTPVSAYFP